MDTTLPLALFLLFLLTANSSASEMELLLTFKSTLQDPTSHLSNWSPTTNNNPCNWTGVTCSIPSSITALDLSSLNLSGEISPSICQLPHLSHLNLAHNPFNQPLPLHLSRCTNLLTLNLSSTLLWGPLPHQLSLLSSLTSLDLSNNRIEGQVPLALGSLPSLQILNLGSNWFSGPLHPSLFPNLTQLELLDFSGNPSLGGSQLPPEIGKLGKLKWVFMQSSGFVGGVPESFLGLHELQILDLSQNNLTGRVPLGFGLGLAKLVSVDFSQNKLNGPFPADVCNGKALVWLSLHENFFIGSVPDSIAKCPGLEKLQLQDNGFSGAFPLGLWSLPEIRLIRAENNRFSGELPDLIGFPSSLEQVQIDNNSFTGRIPRGLGMIHTMYRFSASLNGLTGTLPENFCGSPLMSIINLSRNSLSGPIPELRNCRKLVSLSLAGNSFTGEIPNSLANLPVLTYIDLSSNKLSGEIPPGLQNLKLALFNVSFNQLSGTVPLPLISGLPASFLQGNQDLCGPGLANPCNKESERKQPQTKGLILALVAIAFATGVTILAIGLYVIYRLSQRKSSSSNWNSVFFYSLRITDEEILNELTKKNAIGGGAFGEVYAIQLPGGEFVAVKRLANTSNMSLRSVKAEIKTLAKARHKGLAKLLGFCYLGNSILLIHEYLPKGSLGDALNRSRFTLDWRTRWRIALGAAQGLAYLHKDSVPGLLHRGMKSNNVLLDLDFEPKITGYGLDRIVGEAAYRSSMDSESDSYCYMAPEHGCSKKATKEMDVYSFGVVLLELITGWRSSQQSSEESLDVVKWVRRKINMKDGYLQVLDPSVSTSSQQEMLEVLDLALRCTSVVPDKRPGMPEVVRSLQFMEPIKHSPPRASSGEISTAN